MVNFGGNGKLGHAADVHLIVGCDIVAGVYHLVTQIHGEPPVAELVKAAGLFVVNHFGVEKTGEFTLISMMSCFEPLLHFTDRQRPQGLQLQPCSLAFFRG